MDRKTTSLTIRPTLFSYIVIFLTAILAVSIGAESPPPGSSTQDQNDKQYLHDGPYVFWIGDSVIVKNLCDGQIKTSVYATGHSIPIPRGCGDTLPSLEIFARAPTPEPDTYTNIPKIFAVSDIHGNFDKMVALLQGNGIIDEKLHWRWDTGHLVFVGDIFDRGPKMTEALWFIYRLEKEARKAGGNVHLILGNHEVLVLRNDIRYVHEKYITLTSKKLRIRMSDLYGPETELGRWLRSKNIIFKINNILFVHGGVSPILMRSGFTSQRVNSEIRKSLDARDYLLRFDKDLALLFGRQGPLWYRGYFPNRDDPPASTEQIDSLLTFFDASTVVVGHTIGETITSLYNGRIFAIDTGMHTGSPGEGLFWENDKFYKCDINGNQIPMK
ncbi:MAG: metallophosphoesterase [Candidatus Neomarinimicrobiota bacterium]